MNHLICASMLRDRMTIEHQGSGQHYIVSNVKHTNNATTWAGQLINGEKWEHEFSAPPNFSLGLIAESADAAPVKIRQPFTSDQLRDILADVLNVYHWHHQGDDAGRPWLARALQAINEKDIATSAPDDHAPTSEEFICAFCDKPIWQDMPLFGNPGGWRHDSPGTMPICNHIPEAKGYPFAVVDLDTDDAPTYFATLDQARAAGRLNLDRYEIWEGDVLRMIEQR